MSDSTQDSGLIKHVLHLYFAVVVADNKLHPAETQMVLDQASALLREVLSVAELSMDSVEQALGSYQLDISRHSDTGDQVFPTPIIEDAIDNIGDNALRSSLLKQMLAIALADGEAHNNELAVLKHAAKEWGMEDGYAAFQHAILSSR